MRSVLALLLVGVLLWFMIRSYSDSGTPESGAASEPGIESGDPLTRADGGRRPVASSGSGQSPTAEQYASLMRQIEESGTYLPQILEERDSMLIRWSDRRDRPLTVFLMTPDLEGYSNASRGAVIDAFRRWERVAEIPVDFRYVRDGAGADVVVKWIRAFPDQKAGEAEVTWRADGWIQRGTLTLATHVPGGGVITPDGTFTVALHEIGHLLGLGHSDDPRDVMAPATSVHDLTPRDRRTAMLLYNLDPGWLKAPR